MMIVPNFNSVYGMVEMLIQLGGSGDDEFTIERNSSNAIYQ